VLMGARVGDTVTWRRPAGDLELTIEAIEYS
jgi:transcription elongation GreA/GreB family factor